MDMFSSFVVPFAGPEKKKTIPGFQKLLDAFMEMHLGTKPSTIGNPL